MRNGKIIAHTKRERNLFTLDLAAPNQAMSAKVMAIRGRGRPTHLVSPNKRIRLWHRCLAYVSNARVVRASKLVDGIDLGPKKEYDPAEVLIDSDDSEASADENESPDDINACPALPQYVPAAMIPAGTTISDQTPSIRLGQMTKPMCWTSYVPRAWGASPREPSGETRA